MINKFITNPFFLLTGLISLLVISEVEIGAYVVAGIAENTGYSFISSIILNLMELRDRITLFLFESLINIVVYITIFLVIVSRFKRG